MTAGRDARPVGRRAQVLRLLRESKEPMSIAQVADQLGIHVNTARFHLETLLDNGQVEHVASVSGAPGRPAKLFRVPRGMDPMGPRHYRVLAEVLATTLSAGTDSRQARAAMVDAGRSWGRAHAARLADTAPEAAPADAADPVELLVEMLDDLDFAPERRAESGRTRIGLRNCPFLELAVERSDVVCPVHLGLMRGAMETWDASDTVERLDAFVEPDLCVAHLTTNGAT